MNIPASSAPYTIMDATLKPRVSSSGASMSDADTATVAVKVNVPEHSESGRQKTLERELSDANRKLADDGSEVRFEYDTQAGRLIVRLVAIDTNEVLRQFPSDEALSAARMVKSGKPLIYMQA